MKTLVRRLGTCISTLALFLCMIGMSPTQVHAAEMQTDNKTTTQIGYIFTAGPGDSLSRVVRRAMQLRGVSDASVAMFCENILTAALGNGYLEIGQNVTITFAQIDGCKTAAQILTPEQRAAWQAYADTVSFELNDLTPSTLTQEAPVTPSKQESQQTSSTNTTESQTAKPSESTKTDNKSSAGWYWWLIGVGALIIVFFVLGGSLPSRRLNH